MPRTSIGPETRVAGALHGKDDLHVEGVVDGPIYGEAGVTVAAGSKVNGEVRGRDVVIGGRLAHNVYGSASVRLLATAELFGDIQSPRIAIDEGAQFEGQVRMQRAPEMHQVKPVPPPLATAPSSAPASREIPSLPPVGKRKLVRRTP